MSIHDTPAYCQRCGGKHTGRKGQHCKQGAVAPSTVIGDSRTYWTPSSAAVNEFTRNEFSEGRADGRTSR
jgi:hypothetical protein